MISYFNDKNLMRCNCSMVYILYVAANLRFSQGINTQATNTYQCANGTITSNSGTLSNAIFPDVHNKHENCLTNISIQAAIIIEITFEVFQTESVSNLNLQNEMCILDYLEITVNNRTFRLCGDWRGKERLLYFIFNTSFISIRFHSTERTSKQLIVLMWVSTTAPNIPGILTCQHSLLETATSCFEVVTKPEDWLSGQKTCRRRGASLARIEDLQTQAALEDRLHDRQFNLHSIWIGANDRLFESDFMWPDRSAIQYHNWFPGWLHFYENATHSTRQPSDDGYSNEDCVEIRRIFYYPGHGTGLNSSFFWNDRDCEERNPFICQHDKAISKRSTDHKPLQCGELIQLTMKRASVIVTSPGYPHTYPQLASCHTIVTAPAGKQIFVDFIHFDIEDSKRCEYDNLSISDLPVTSNRHPSVHCGNWNTKLKLLRWSSEVNKVTISFQSDNTKQFSGFTLNATIIDYANLCDDSSSFIPSTFGPGGCWFLVNGTKNYTDAQDSCSSVGANMSSGLLDNVNFAAQLLNDNDGCTKTWLPLEIWDNSSNAIDNNSLCNAVQICGSHNDGRNILIEYDTIITQVSCTSLNTVLCQKPATQLENEESETNITSRSGTIDFYNKNGHDYNNSITFTLYFIALAGYRIIIELHAYDIEFQDECIYDYIDTVGMVTNRKYCGKYSEPVTLISKSNNASILFSTDGDVTASGFNLSWHWVKMGEAFQISVNEEENVSMMRSLNYPREFPAEIRNCLYLELPANKRLYVTIEDLILPGNNCNGSSFDVYSDSVAIKSFCGVTRLDDLEYFARYLLLDGANISFCLTVPHLKHGEGILARLAFVEKSETMINTMITVEPNETKIFSSLMFPKPFPANTTQNIIVRTNIGYKIVINLHNITMPRHTNCPRDKLAIMDISLKYDHDDMKFYSCLNLTNDAEYIGTIGLHSVLNAVRLIISSGYLVHSLKFTGIISSVEDPSYLENTILAKGTFDECENDSCKNGGSCSITNGSRFTCTCQPQYTGVFCQAGKCDLNPCQHGTCLLTSTGFSCKCDAGYWGSTCTMNSIICEYMYCSGHGRCVTINDTDTGCVCNNFFKGPRCSIPIPSAEDNLTIGQKLLKEPIWIGMIVILNLILFFCISYVIRRKCGKKISKLFPKRAKPKNTKDYSNTDPSPFRLGTAERIPNRNVYSISIDTPPNRSLGSRWSVSKQSGLDKCDSISPSTPIVNDDNKEAAMKFFASYSIRQDDASPNITSVPDESDNNLGIQTRDILSCGIQGGSVTLSPHDAFNHHEKEATHGILRSYTISTEIQDFESRRSKARNEIKRKSFSYSGSPTNSHQISAGLTEPYPKNSLNEWHCYPEIRIINENDSEEAKISDTDYKSDTKIHTIKRISQSKSVDNIHEIKTCDHHDSGYPSTTLSTTHSSSQVDDISNMAVVPSASERRKLFSSKAKSASFYEISVANDIVSKESKKKDIRAMCIHVTHDSEMSDISFKNSTSEEFRSFESERCASCHREKIERCAFSYETDLDKIHRSKGRQYSADRSTYSHQKRHRHRRKCGCSKHNSYNKEYESFPRHHTQSLSLLHNHYLSTNSHHSSIRDGRDINRYGHHIRPLNSSTESDSCLCSVHELRHHRKHGHIKDAFSGKSFHKKHGSPRQRDFDSSPRIDFQSDDSCKSNLMKSFLSDTYRQSNRVSDTYRQSNRVSDTHRQSNRVSDIHRQSNRVSDTHRQSNRVYFGHSEDMSDDARQSTYYILSPHNSSSSREKSPQTPSPLHLPLCIPIQSDTFVEKESGYVAKLDVTPASPANSEFVQQQSISPMTLNPIALFDFKQVHDKKDNGEYKKNDEPSRKGTHTVISEYLKVLPEVEYISKDKYADNGIMQTINPRIIADGDTKFTRVTNEAIVRLKDSAYQTKQSSLDKYKNEKLVPEPNVVKSKQTEILEPGTRYEDKVQEHLQQAALKLALLKRIQSTKEYSKDSAIHTFSEEDLSADDVDTHVPLMPLAKRVSGSLAFQFRETNLSQVQEEITSVSRDTDSYNTPTNERLYGSFDKASSDKVNSPGIPMSEMSNAKCDANSVRLEETNV